MLPLIANSSCVSPSIFMFMPFVTLIYEKSYTSEPDALASPPPNTVPVISILAFYKFSFPTATYPIFVFVIPYTFDVFAPPYTFPYIVPPTILTVL